MGTLTTVLGLLMVLWALPTQAVKNHKEKKCGIVLPRVVLPTVVYIVRAIYASQKGAWGIVVPDIIGVSISLIILAQWFIYNFRKKNT